MDTYTQHLSDGTWLTQPLTEREARNMLIAELGGIWTATRIDAAAFTARAMVVAWNNGDLTEREAEALLRYTSSEGPRPIWLADLIDWKHTYLTKKG